MRWMESGVIHDVVRFLPRATTLGMVIVVALQLAGSLSLVQSLLDVLILGVLGVVARILLRSRDPGPREQ